MEYSVKKVTSKEAAISAIEARQHKIVELDYEGGANDVFELARLGRKNIVGVQFISQESITIANETVLKQYLSKPKQTFKQRFLTLEFNLDSSSLAEYQKQLSEHGDLILPKGFLPTQETISQ
ncbi:conserved hypothetical protein [Vibrio jasicida]|uniref:PHA-granule associated protein 4 n=1 Tax=Vibrio jasicida TaxID=766224 RepID=A0AAU9QW05_9VIBR|nr:conserved hypothetical protein [Vibrio jasicida]CAH1601735.1 conserved hypothetical protein [Vibrio jasicida]